MSKKIDDSVAKELIVLNKKNLQEQREKLRMMENEARRLEGQKIDAGARMDLNGWSENVVEKDKDGNPVPVKVWAAAGKLSDEILNSSSMKAFDDYRSAMMNLMGLYHEINAALFYSAGEVMPGFMDAFAKDYNEFKEKYPEYAKFVDSVPLTFRSIVKPMDVKYEELKQDFLQWAIAEKKLHTYIPNFFPDFLTPDPEALLAENIDYARTSLVAQDLIDIAYFNENPGKSHGPIARLPMTEKNKEKMQEFGNTFNAVVKLWLGQHGYVHKDVGGKQVYADSNDNILTKADFEKLRLDKNNSLESFLTQEFAEDISHHYSPRI